MSLHFQASPVNSNRLAAVCVRITVLGRASCTASHYALNFQITLIGDTLSELYVNDGTVEAKAAVTPLAR